MTAKHRHDTGSTTARPGRRWRVPALLSAAAVVGTSLTVGLAAGPAEAAAPTVDVFLSGLGAYTSECKATPSNVVFIKPGTVVRFHADTLGLQAATGLNLTSLQTTMTNPLNNSEKIKLGAGGVASKPVSFGSSGGNFTWSSTLTSVSIAGIVIPLPGLQAATGAKLSWAGTISVNSRTQTGCRLAPQLPSVQVSPSLPVVGQLPGVNVPGVQLPGVNVPSVNVPLPGQSGSSSPSAGTTAPSTTAPKPGTTTTSPTNPYGYDAPDCTGPCAVVPKGGSSGGQVGGAYGVTLGDLGDAAANGTGGGGNGADGSNGSDAAAIAGVDAGGAGSDQLAVDRAFSQGAVGGTAPALPTALTIAAVAALAGASVLWFARRRLARG